MSTLSLAMIVKNEGATIERVLDCAKSFADEMIVVDTGSTDVTVAKALARGAVVHRFDWIDDFAAARNFAFSKCAGDWILWLDGDDVVAPEDQRKILELKRTVLGADLDAVYLRYVYPPFKQWRERIVRRDLFVRGKLRWVEPIHEVIDGIDPRKVRYFDDIAILHDTPPDRAHGKIDRNLTILRRHIASGAGSDRTLYIYAVECLHSLQKEEAERALQRFFAQVAIPEYRYEVLCKMHAFYAHFGDSPRALDALTKAIVEDPSRAEAYYRLGQRMNQADRPAAALPLLALAGSIPLPSSGTPETEAYGHGPREAAARANFRLERWEAAAAAAREALQHGSPARDFLGELARWEAGYAAASLPAAWQEWVEGNLASGVPRHVVIRVLEEHRYRPNEIRAALAERDRKRAAATR